MYGMQCWSAIRDTYQSWPTLPSRKIVLLTMWNDLLQDFIDIKAVILFKNSHQSCVAAAGGHSEHSV